MVLSDTGLIIGITVAYLLIVVGVGFYAARATGKGREEYLMASRSFGTIISLAAIFATNMTAVMMIGAPGLAYTTGPSTYGFFNSLWGLLVGLFLMTFGYRIWTTGKVFGHITPSQIINHRLETTYLGILIMIMFTIWTIPYILVGVQGGGIVFEALTDGVVPYWLGALTVIVIVGLYVYPGGMRGTGWTNAFQGGVFITVLLAVFLYIPLSQGGFSEMTAASVAVDETLLNRAGIPQYEPRMWFSQGLIVALGAFMFPHLIMRYMTARSPKTLGRTGVLYTAAMLIAWIPAVTIGFWGAGQVMDIQEPDFILPVMVAEVLPVWAIGLALAGILAAIMSSFDAQVLTLSTFFSEDVLAEFSDDISDAKLVWYTRVFLVVIFILAYIGALLTTETIIDTATFAFAGYGLMFIPFLMVLYWTRATKASAYAGFIYGFVGVWLFELGVLPESLAFGFHPFVPLLITQALLIVIVAIFTSPPSEERIEEYEQAFEGIW